MTQASDNDVMRIDLKKVLSERLPRYRRWIPGFVIRWLERLICQDQMNLMLEECRGMRDADFCRGVLKHLDVTTTVTGSEKLPPSNHRRVTIVSNHPLGGLDGMALIDFVDRHWGRGAKFIVNDLLMAIEPLSDTFIPINKHGSQSRGASSGIDAAMLADNPVIIFPAGLCSRRGADGLIRDLEWQKMFVNKSIKYERDIIPLHFGGHNSSFFYKFARLRSRLGIKFNLEMVRLPAEVFRCRGAGFTITVGNMIPWQQLSGGSEARAEAARIKETVYSLAPQPSDATA